jgi:hypothetical protein
MNVDMINMEEISLCLRTLVGRGSDYLDQRDSMSIQVGRGA